MKIAAVTITSQEYDNKWKVHKESVEKYFPTAYIIKYRPESFQSIYKNTLQHILASRPEAVLRTFEQGYDAVLFMGADVVFYKEPEELINNYVTNNAVFFPHILKPLPEDDLFPMNSGIMKTGHINSDFVFWKNCPEVINFLEWQKEMLQTKCTDEYFYDQNLLNFAPMFIDNTLICRNPKYNVAYWNFKQRDWKDCVCFQFSGFDLDNPKSISTHQNRYEAEGDFLNFLETYTKRVKGFKT